MSVSAISSAWSNSALFGPSSLSSTIMSTQTGSTGSGSSLQIGPDTASISPMAQQMSDFQSLDKALLSGDLTDAQTAYSALANDIQNTTDANNPLTSNSQLSQDLKNVSTALQSGDLSGAQNAFSTLKTDMQSAFKAGHPHGGPGRRPMSSQMTQEMSDFKTLAQSIQSGSATSAQSALSTLLQDIQSNASSNSYNPFTANSQVSDDLQSLESAVQSGNMSSAQSAFSVLAQDMVPPGMNGAANASQQTSATPAISSNS